MRKIWGQRPAVARGSQGLKGILFATTTAIGIGMAGFAPAWIAGEVLAQTSPATQPVAFNIPAGSLAAALAAFGDRAGIQVIYPADLARGQVSPGISGTLTPEAALQRLLNGTNLTYRFTNATTVTLVELPQAGNATMLPALSVEGLLPRLDPGRTEGSGSYGGSATTVGSKTPVAIKDIPQSVSVITRQRIEDQNLVSLEDVLAQSTGVQLRRSTNDVAFFYMRGYQLDSVQLDGVPIPTGQGSTRLATGLDMAAYDRVEVLRGPAGLFQGAGEPTGAVNLVRKRPGDRFSASGALGYGSWDFYRAEADVGGPVTDSGKVRARLVSLYEDRKFFYDVAEQQKPMIYGTVEFDLSESTTLSVGAARQEISGMPYGGLPTYADGRFADLSRSTYLDADWAYSDSNTTDTFAELDHRLNNGGQVKLSTRFVDRTYDLKRLFNTAPIDPVTGTTPLNAQRIAATQEDVSLDGYVSTPFELFGQTHNAVAGINYRNSQFGQKSGAVATGLFQDVFAPVNNLPEPFVPYTSDAEQEQTQYGPYGQLRVKPIDWTTVIVGGRMSWVNQQNRNRMTDVVTAKYSVDEEFTPYAALVFDLTKNIALYGSYSSIFQPQSQATTAGALIDPRTGDQYETGIKGEFLDGRLNTHLAAFQLRDENRALAIDGCVGLNCFVAAGEVESKGFEMEVSGQVMPGWNIYSGYAYTITEYLQGAAAQTGTAFSTYNPRHIFNLWTNYEILTGNLRGLSFGGGVRAMSGFDYEFGGAVRPEQDAYAVFGAQVGYRLTDYASLNLTVENLFDENYFERVNGTIDGNRYGEPRNVMLSLRARW